MNHAVKFRKKAYLAREWLHTYLWTKQKTGVTPYGFKLTVSSYAANRQMLSGNFEKEEVETVISLLDRKKLFVDVGANIGYYSLLAAKKGLSVISVEPKQSNAKLLLKNIFDNNWGNGEIVVHPVGLSEKEGLLPLFGATGTAASLVKGWAGHSANIKELIPVTTLDKIMKDVPLDIPALVKVDVEGAEDFVLRGATRLLEKYENITWLIEVCFSEYHAEGINPYFREVFKKFFDHGYRCTTADKNSTPVTMHDIDQWIQAKKRLVESINYIFTKPH